MKLIVARVLPLAFALLVSFAPSFAFAEGGHAGKTHAAAHTQKRAKAAKPHKAAKAKAAKPAAKKAKAPRASKKAPR